MLPPDAGDEEKIRRYLQLQQSAAQANAVNQHKNTSDNDPAGWLVLLGAVLMFAYMAYRNFEAYMLILPVFFGILTFISSKQLKCLFYYIIALVPVMVFLGVLGLFLSVFLGLILVFFNILIYDLVSERAYCYIISAVSSIFCYILSMGSKNN